MGERKDMQDEVPDRSCLGPYWKCAFHYETSCDGCSDDTKAREQPDLRTSCIEPHSGAEKWNNLTSEQLFWGFDLNFSSWNSGVLCCLLLSGKLSSQKLPKNRAQQQDSHTKQWWNASKTKLAALFPFPLPPCLFLPRSHLPLNAALKLKASLVLGVEEQMQLERRFFFLHLMENELTSGIRSLRASSYGELVQYQVSDSSQHFHFSNRAASTCSLPSQRAVDCVNFVLPSFTATQWTQKIKTVWRNRGGKNSGFTVFMLRLISMWQKVQKWNSCEEEEARGSIWRGRRSESRDHDWPPSAAPAETPKG